MAKPWWVTFIILVKENMITPKKIQKSIREDSPLLVSNNKKSIEQKEEIKKQCLPASVVTSL